jgi:hypothetical protein
MRRINRRPDAPTTDSAADRAVGKTSRTARLARRAAGSGPVDPAAALDSVSGSSGAPLPGAARERFEQSLGVDLGGVRVHTGAASAQAARDLQAQAFTTGADIHFGDGHYRPDDPYGMHLLAHEVAHTVQQGPGGAGAQAKVEVSEPDDPLEHEADRAADAMVAGQPTAVTTGTVSAARRIARFADGAETLDFELDADSEPAAAASDGADRDGEDDDAAPDEALSGGGGGGGGGADDGAALDDEDDRSADMEPSGGGGGGESEADEGGAGEGEAGERAPAGAAGGRRDEANGGSAAAPTGGDEADAAAGADPATTAAIEELGAGGGSPAPASDGARETQDVPAPDSAVGADRESAPATAPVQRRALVQRQPDRPASAAMLGADWLLMNEAAIVQDAAGANLRSSPSQSATFVNLPQQTKVQIVKHNPKARWYYVVTTTGQVGYIADWLLFRHLPEPGAEIYLIKAGDTPIDIARAHYGRDFTRWGQDLRFVVNALVYVNTRARHNGPGGSGLAKPESVNESWLKAQAKANVYIWLPSTNYLNSIFEEVRKRGGGTGSRSFDFFAKVAPMFGEFSVIPSYLGGLVHGFVSCIADTVSSIFDLLKSIFSGELISDLKQLWNALSKLTQRPVGGDLALAGVDRHLRLDRDVADPVAVRDVEPLDRDVAQHLGVVAVVAGQERLVDRAVLGRELPEAQVVGDRQVGRGGGDLGEDRGPVLEGHEQKRVIAQLVGQAGVDRFVGQVGEGVGGVGLTAGRAAEPDAGLAGLARREDPGQAVQRAGVLGRVVLEGAAQAAQERRLGRAVGAVQEDQATRSAVAHEAGQRAMDLALGRLLADQPALAPGPRRVEQVPARGLAPRIADRRRAVVREAVEQVLRRRPELLARLGEHQLEVLGERHHPPGVGELAADGLAEAGQPRLDRRGRHRLDDRAAAGGCRTVLPPMAAPDRLLRLEREGDRGLLRVAGRLGADRELERRRHAVVAGGGRRQLDREGELVVVEGLGVGRQEHRLGGGDPGRHLEGELGRVVLVHVEALAGPHHHPGHDLGAGGAGHRGGLDGELGVGAGRDHLLGPGPTDRGATLGGSTPSGPAGPVRTAAFAGGPGRGVDRRRPAGRTRLVRLAAGRGGQEREEDPAVHGADYSSDPARRPSRPRRERFDRFREPRT